MDLNEEEKKKIISLIKAGHVLPDEYRWKLFKDPLESELIWPGKTHEVCKVSLPFQTIEHIDEQLKRKANKSVTNNGWSNKLIWGENKLILASLKQGPLRRQIEDAGGIKLIYIDPPFDVGANFSCQIEVGSGDSYTKKPNIIEEIAYRDTWGRGIDSYISMIAERMRLIKELLADDGSLYVHCDWRASSYLRLVLDEVFGKENFINQISWCYQDIGSRASPYFKRKHDDIFLYGKTEERLFNIQKGTLAESTIKRYEKYFDSNGQITYKSLKKTNPGVFKKLKGIPSDLDTIWLDLHNGAQLVDWWSDISPIKIGFNEHTNYPTQKPEALLERIISASSNEGDLIADFFCGSGTTLSVAERLNRKWIGCDLSRFAIHTSRKRLVDVQKKLNISDKFHNSFEILNLGHYDRQYYIGIDAALPKHKRDKISWQKEQEYISLILEAYRAKPIVQSSTFHGQKGDVPVFVGAIDSPVTQEEINKVIKECTKFGFKRADVLGFDFEMGSLSFLKDKAKEKGVVIGFKYIPNDVFDKRAIEKGQVNFYDVAYVEVEAEIKKNQVTIYLKDFGVYYIQENIRKVTENLRNGATKVIVHNGQVLKIKKEKSGEITKEILTKKWTDWIDYWAVDFDYESRSDEAMGSFVFENDWQTFRTKNDRVLQMISGSHKYTKPGKYKVAIKVIDIFGNDTTKVIPITIR